MDNANATGAPGWYRLVAILGLLWSLLGLSMYLQHVGLFGDPTAGLSEAERALADSTPAWVTGAFAVATVAAVLGTLALVMRRRWATTFLFISLAAVLAQQLWVLFVSDAVHVHGMVAWIVPFVIFNIALLLLLLANFGARRGWLV